MRKLVVVIAVVGFTTFSASAQTRSNEEGWLTDRQIQAIQKVLRGDTLPLKDKFFDEWQRWEPDKLPTTRALLTQMGKEPGWQFVVARPKDPFARYYFVNERKKKMIEAGVDLDGKHPVLILNFYVNHWADVHAPPK